jgi:hypothetical protein
MDDGLVMNLPHLDPLGLCSKGEPSRHQTQDYEYKHPENLPPSPHLSISLFLSMGLLPKNLTPFQPENRTGVTLSYPCLPPCLLENYANPETEAANLRYLTQQIEPTFSPVCLMKHSTGRAGKLLQGMQLLLLLL